MMEEFNTNKGLVSSLGDWRWCDSLGKDVYNKERIWARRLLEWYFGNVDFEETEAPKGYT